jgi:predicted dithiol-disulfide oxidoreductase (DUF899 family)
MTNHQHNNDQSNNQIAAMKKPPVVSAEQWQRSWDELLVKEKELTHARDAMAAARRRMPWLAVEKPYVFEGPQGKRSLLDLFDGRRQLVLYRAFYDPDVYGWPDHACVGCSLGADQVSHHARLCLARLAGKHRPPPTPHGLGKDPLVHHHRQLR